MSRSSRPTIPSSLHRAAHDTEREFEAADSDIRPLVSLAAVPWLVVTHDQPQRLPLGGRAGFVASLIDGRCTVEMMLDISGMREDETLGIIAELVRLRAVELRDAR